MSEGGSSVKKCFSGDIESSCAAGSPLSLVMTHGGKSEHSFKGDLIIIPITKNFLFDLNAFELDEEF